MIRIITKQKFEKFLEENRYHISPCPCGCGILYVFDRTHSPIMSYNGIKTFFGKRIEKYEKDANDNFLYHIVLCCGTYLKIKKEFLIEEKPLFVEIKE